MKSGVVHACTNMAEYHAALQSAGDRLVVLDCGADWCPPCRHMAPIFERLAGEYPDVVFLSVNVEHVPQIKTAVGNIWALPTFVFLRSGEKQGSFMGADVNKLRHGLEHNGYVSICGGCAIL